LLVEPCPAKAPGIARAFKQLAQDPSFCPKLRLGLRGDGTRTIPVLKISRQDRADDTPPPDNRLTLLHISRYGRPAHTGPGSADQEKDLAGSVVLQYAAISETSTLPVRNQEANPYFVRALPERMIRADTLSEQEALGRLWANYLIPSDFHAVIHGSNHLTA